jgi:hypothetical protein
MRDVYKILYGCLNFYLDQIILTATLCEDMHASVVECVKYILE